MRVQNNVWPSFIIIIITIIIKIITITDYFQSFSPIPFNLVSSLSSTDGFFLFLIFGLCYFESPTSPLPLTTQSCLTFEIIIFFFNLFLYLPNVFFFVFLPLEQFRIDFRIRLKKMCSWKKMSTSLFLLVRHRLLLGSYATNRSIASFDFINLIRFASSLGPNAFIF